MTNDGAERIEAFVTWLAEPIADALKDQLPPGVDLTDTLAEVRLNVTRHIEEKLWEKKRMQITREPEAQAVTQVTTTNEKTPYKREIVGEYQQSRAASLPDADGKKYRVEAGLYPVFGAVSLDKSEVYKVGIVFDAVDKDGKRKTLLEFHDGPEAAQLAQRGKIQLAEGYTQSMFVAPKQAKGIEQTRVHKPTDRVQTHTQRLPTALSR